jgi:thioredoxin reductase (NADPH)
MSATSASRGRTPPPQAVLFAIDDDPGAVHALRDDLSRRFGQEFRIICESSATAGLAAVRELEVRRVPVALLIVGQELTGMSGVTFLGRAHQMHPQAVRILLVERDYSARSPIVQAMILGQADSHITKPWMLEQDLYSVVSVCLADWAKNSEAAFDLVSIVGLDDRAGNELRELLTRFNVPFRFVAADSGAGRHLLREHGLDESRLPVLVRYDGHAAVTGGT